MVNRNICTLIHPGPAGTRRAPLFLLHDGGGTIFSYFLLKPLNRPTYGITNPRTSAGQQWEGGLRQMADDYLEIVRDVAQGRPVLIGGWSLGGVVAFEMAHLELMQHMHMPAGKSRLQILGLVLIDSVYPCPQNVPDTVEKVNYEAEFEAHVKQDTRARVEYAMIQTDGLLDEWRPPAWETAPESTDGLNGETARHRILPPPAMLLRARDAVPLPQNRPGMTRVVDVDLSRARRFLGWEDYPTKFIRNVLDVSGHHHNIFKDPNITSVDAKLRIACRSLDPGT